MRNKIAGFVLWALGVKCGDYGGVAHDKPRWCYKRFGHIDSHAYEDGLPQPLWSVRRRAQGWPPL